MVFSVYYLVAVQHNLPVIFKVTVYIRCTIIFFFTAFVLLNLMKPIMLVFVVIDFAGGVWTYLAKKRDGMW